MFSLRRSTAVVIASARNDRLTSIVATTAVGGMGSEALRRVWSRSDMAAASAAGTGGAVQSCGLPKASSSSGWEASVAMSSGGLAGAVMSSGGAASDATATGWGRRGARRGNGTGAVA